MDKIVAQFELKCCKPCTVNFFLVTACSTNMRHTSVRLMRVRGMFEFKFHSARCLFICLWQTHPKSMALAEGEEQYGMVEKSPPHPLLVCLFWFCCAGVGGAFSSGCVYSQLLIRKSRRKSCPIGTRSGTSSHTHTHTHAGWYIHTTLERWR